MPKKKKWRKKSLVGSTPGRSKCIILTVGTFIADLFILVSMDSSYFQLRSTFDNNFFKGYHTKLEKQHFLFITRLF